MNDSLLVWRCARARWSALGVCVALLTPRAAFAQAAPDPTPAPAEPSKKAAPPAEADADAASAEGDEAAAAEAEMAAEEKASVAKSQKPAPKGKGVVWGTITDTKSNGLITIMSAMTSTST